jgi:hypothetical protein
MSHVVYGAAPWWSGIRHRFVTLNQLTNFARHRGYTLHFLWGVSEAVGYCRFEELFSPLPGIGIINLSEFEIKELERIYRRSRTIPLGNQTFAVYRPGDLPEERMFVFDLWGDFEETTALLQLVPADLRLPEHLRAHPSSALKKEADGFIHLNNLSTRVGIRIRVTENPNDGRSLCRRQQELDRTIKSIIGMPWYVPVFVVTDSEYVLQMLTSHFHNIRFLAKKYTERDIGGNYVDRRDRAAMRTYVVEVACLTACRKIVNFGGFINEESVYAKIVEPPWEPSLFGLRSAIVR